MPSRATVPSLRCENDELTTSLTTSPLSHHSSTTSTSTTSAASATFATLASTVTPTTTCAIPGSLHAAVAFANTESTTAAAASSAHADRRRSNCSSADHDTGSTNVSAVPYPGDRATVPSVVMSSRRASSSVYALEPICFHQVGLRSASEGISPFSRSRSCESAWVMLDYGVTAEQGTRRTMEDQHTMLAGGIPFFGVYDGHGGTQCAEYLRDNLHTMILSHPEITTNPEKAIREGFVEADRCFLERCASENLESGSVCAVALFVQGTLVVGNVGDAEVVLCRGGCPVQLTVPHNPKKNAKEAERIVAAGGRVFRNRVGHPKFNPSAISLAVSRAIGDAGFKAAQFTDGKPSGIIADPDTKSIKLVPEDEFLLIGCDGLWDVISHAEAVNFSRELVRTGHTPRDITEKLVDEALRKGTTDNVTVAFVSCKPIAEAAASGTPLQHNGRPSPRISSATSAHGMVPESSISSSGRSYHT